MARTLLAPLLSADTREHRTAMFGYPREHDGPAMSIVYYPKVSLRVLDEQWPPSYLQIDCDATTDTDSIPWWT
jgi:hypothetical protein